jgi:hypothetical protein
MFSNVVVWNLLISSFFFAVLLSVLPQFTLEHRPTFIYHYYIFSIVIRRFAYISFVGNPDHNLTSLTRILSITHLTRFHNSISTCIHVASHMINKMYQFWLFLSFVIGLWNSSDCLILFVFHFLKTLFALNYFLW